MERMPEKIDSKYRYVLLASVRAEQMVGGARAKVEGVSTKPTRLAMQEISADLVDWDYGPAEEPEEELLIDESLFGEEEAEEGGEQERRDPAGDADPAPGHRVACRWRRAMRRASR